MPEIAINVPLDSNEIKEIICEELRKRLDGLSPLQGAKEYASFSANFNVTVRLRRVGDVVTPKETLAWGTVTAGTVDASHQEETVVENFDFSSGDPNEERQSRGMALTVEAPDGRGGKVRRRVLVKE